MSLFSNILEKLGLKKPSAAAAPTPSKPMVGDSRPAPSMPSTPKPAAPVTSTVVPPQTLKPAEVKPEVASIEVVDVVARLEAMAARNPQKLNWKVSIVDLLKLLDLDSSLAARKELATELGCPPEKMGGDYSEMNVWLHKTVLQKIAENGGNIPKELLD